MLNINKYDRFELAMEASFSGNAFTDVNIEAYFQKEGSEEKFPVFGFYDGDNQFKIRFMPKSEGVWKYSTKSNLESLNRIEGNFLCVEPKEGNHGPVKVIDGFHFAYDDGTPYFPFGTTAYNWTNQESELVTETLNTLAENSFNKIRFSPFPKHYLYNFNEPIQYPFKGGLKDPKVNPEFDKDVYWSIPDFSLYAFDFEQLNPDFFKAFEKQIDALDALGIQADIILFHPYDRWGFSKMPQKTNLMYINYMVARLASYANVWWSMANEWDFVHHRTVDEWEELAHAVVDQDPVHHLISIHNGTKEYDNHKPWITHLSWQRINVFTHVDQTVKYRQTYNKPFVIDEVVYEGNIDQGWGNITGEELTRRFWETAVRGGYCTHGETYMNSEEILWWAKGGKLIGTSPERIRFLRQFLEGFGSVTPLTMPHVWDITIAGNGQITERPFNSIFGSGSCQYADKMFCYFGFMQPCFRYFRFPEEYRYKVTIIDTWEMTQTVLDTVYTGNFRLDLPGKTGIAVRFDRILE